MLGLAHQLSARVRTWGSRSVLPRAPLLVVLVFFTPGANQKMMFLSRILDGQGQLQRSSLSMGGSVKVGYIKLLQHPTKR